MIHALVDFSLKNRFLVLTAAILLLIWGGISFHNLPVEAYPDVANNYVTIITQWPGHAAEEVEQQVSIPIEIAMNGIPHITSLRSVSLAGLSSVTMIFDDESQDDANRAKVVERITQVSLPAGLQPQIGTDWSPVGQIYFFTLHSTNPKYDVMELKTLEDWVVERAFKSVPNVVDVASFGGPTREYQVRVDPDKLTNLVKDRLANKVDKRVFIKSDARARYGNVVDVVDNVRSAGVDDVGLLTEQKKSGAEAQAPPAPAK